MKYSSKLSTAVRVNWVRAWESNNKADMRICFDPIAEKYLPLWAKLIVKTRLGRKLFWRNYSPFQIGILGYVPLRTKLIDDYLQECIENGMAQLVILGAGFDSRAYRLNELKDGIIIFEVDHPKIQIAKLSRLKQVFGSVPKHVTYVPIDFEKDELHKTLSENGYREDLKTLFIWEGVTYYLDAEAVDKTLAFVATGSKPGSSIIFDYIPPDVVDGKSADPLAQDAIVHSEQVGEPIKLGIDPESIGDFLSARGFSQAKNHSMEECKRKYHKKVHENREVANFYSIVHATVSPQSM
jgi:methyltransferase (TIGR00027 family)